MGFDPGSTRRASVFQANGFTEDGHSAYKPGLSRLYHPPWNYLKPRILFNRPRRLSPTFQISIPELPYMSTFASEVPVIHTPFWMNEGSHPCHRPSPNPFRQRPSQGRHCSVYQIPLAASCRIHRRARKTAPSYMKARVAAETDPPFSPRPVSRNSQMCPSRSLSDRHDSNYRGVITANKLDSEHPAQLSQNQLLDHFGVIDTDKGHLCNYYLGCPDGLVIQGHADVLPHSSGGLKDPMPVPKEGCSWKKPQDTNLYHNDFCYLFNGCLEYMYQDGCGRCD